MKQHEVVEKTEPWFGGGAAGFILSKTIVRGNTAPNEIPAKEKPGDDTNKNQTPRPNKSYADKIS
jgi:hypothetical protein